MITPSSSLLFPLSGFLFLTSGGSDGLAKSKSARWRGIHSTNVYVGFVVVICESVNSAAVGRADTVADGLYSTAVPVSRVSEDSLDAEIQIHCSLRYARQEQ
eukprot:scaffold7218_cov52-Attheya_sp.AAC.3